MSIRENILFNLPYEPARYRKTLDACALLPDLASFQHGDLSTIGRMGLACRVARKARVALARAVYSPASILLLDDPISALDQQTAEWIIRRCLTGNLVEGRTIVLVTHRIDICKGLATRPSKSRVVAHGLSKEISTSSRNLCWKRSPRVGVTSLKTPVDSSKMLFQTNSKKKSVVGMAVCSWPYTGNT